MSNRVKIILIGAGILLIAVLVFLPGILSKTGDTNNGGSSGTLPSNPPQTTTEPVAPTPRPTETTGNRQTREEDNHSMLVPDSLRNDFAHHFEGARQYIQYSTDEAPADRLARLSAIFDPATAKLSLEETPAFLEEYRDKLTTGRYTVSMVEDPYMTMSSVNNKGVLVSLKILFAIKELDAEGNIVQIITDQVTITYYYEGVTNENYVAGSLIPELSQPDL